MNSHEYAKILHDTAEHLLSRPVVEVENEPFLYLGFWDKERFVTAARAMGSGQKRFTGTDLRFKPDGTCLELSIGRDKVCRKIQDAKWECEPILSEVEVEQLGEEAVATDEDVPF